MSRASPPPAAPPPYAAGLASDVLSAFTTEDDLAGALQRCCEALVKHVDAAFARIWTLNVATDVLELQASAGMYTHLDGPHGRVRVGELKIGRIADSREPHLTNDVPGDPHIGDPDWARREGMEAFAGYPLIAGDAVVGVMAMFARAPLADHTLGALGLVAHSIAAGIERRRTEEQFRENARIAELLLGVSEAITSSLDLQEVVQAVTDAATELSHAQFGAFFYNVTGASGEKLVLYTISGVPKERFAGYPYPRNTALFGPTFAGEAIVRVDDVTKDRRYGHMPPHHGLPPGHLPVRSYLAAPVKSIGGEVLGGLFFGHPEPGVFTESAQRIVAGIANQAAIAIQNARTHGFTQTVAETLQKSLLGRQLPEVPGLELAARYIPGDPRLDVGGDWHEVVRTDKGVALAVGDVMGKGLSAASLMAQIRAAFHAYVLEGRSVTETLHLLNQLVCRDWPAHMATMCCAVYSFGSDEVEIATAGHPPAVLLPAGDAIFVEDGRGIPLGIDPDVSYTTTRSRLAAGDALMMYTDGLVEDRRSPIDAGLERLRAALIGVSREPEAICEAAIEAGRVAQDAADDVALLVARRTPVA